MNVGTLNVNLTMSSATLSQQTNVAVGEIGRVGQAAANANRAMSSVGMNNGRLFMAAGQMAEDMTINLSNAKDAFQGLQFAIRGGANNIAQMASMVSPMAAGFVGIGIAITSVLLPHLQSALGYTKEWYESQEKLKKSMQESIASTGDMAAFTRGLGGEAADAMRKFEQAWKDFQKKLKDGDNSINVPIVPTIARDKMNSLTKDAEQEWARQQALIQERNDIVRGGGKLTEDQKDAYKTEIAESQKRYRDIARKIDAAKPFADQERMAQLKADAETQQQRARQASEAERAKLERLRDVKMEDERTWQKFLIDEDIKANNEKLTTLRDQQEAIKAMGLTANGPTAAMEAGSAGAFSSIARATMGTATIEDERKAQLKELETQTKELQRINEKLNWKKAEL